MELKTIYTIFRTVGIDAENIRIINGKTRNIDQIDLERDDITRAVHNIQSNMYIMRAVLKLKSGATSVRDMPLGSGYGYSRKGNLVFEMSKGYDSENLVKGKIVYKTNNFMAPYIEFSISV